MDKKIHITIIKILFVLILFSLFLPTPHTTSVTLRGFDSGSGRDEIWLTDIQLNGVSYPLSRVSTNGKWKHLEGNIVYVPDSSPEGDELVLNFLNVNSLEFTFIKHRWSGIVGIQDGSAYTEYNLNDQEGYVNYDAQNILKTHYNGVTICLSTIAIFLVVYLLYSLYSMLINSDAEGFYFRFKWEFLALVCIILMQIFNAYSETRLWLCWFLSLYVIFSYKQNRLLIRCFWGAIFVSYLYYLLYLYNSHLWNASIFLTFLLGELAIVSILYNMKKSIKNIFSRILIPTLCFCMIEAVSNTNFVALSLSAIIVNIGIIFAIFYIIINLFKWRKIGWYMSCLCAVIISVVNYYVIQFKNFPLTLSDLLQFRTGLAVAGGYKYHLSNNIVVGILFLILCFLIIYFCIHQKTMPLKLTIAKKSVSILLACVMGIGIFMVDLENICHISWDEWEPTLTYSQNGFILSFLSSIQRSRIVKPEGYSKENAENILLQYSDVSEATSSSKPIIIAIMNESFADLRDLGSLGDTDNVMQYMDSLSEYLEKGRVYTSVRGGGTCNSEFEFLTGNSLQLFGNVYPYTQYNFSKVPTLVSGLKEQGYRAIAMHPSSAQNYNRKVVYEEMGFDEFYDYQLYEKYEKVVWDRTSDYDDYSEILKIVEQESEDPLFIFNVTIQNHGDYDIEKLNPKYSLIHMDSQYSEYSDAQMYLTLINESNKALQYLMTELKRISRPVILCIFGDHQPGVFSSEFETLLLSSSSDSSSLQRQERYFSTPYLIWSNYNTENQRESAVELKSSPNYLGAKLLYYAGLPKKPYQNFLLKMQEEIPASNRYGYLGDDGEWHDYSENNEYTHWLSDYRILQYYNMFGN